MSKSTVSKPFASRYSVIFTMFDEIRAVIRRIPRGKVATYGQVAEAAGFPGCARQVVWALRDSAMHCVVWLNDFPPQSVRNPLLHRLP